jgi:acetoin utilization deacetylase AcuC-like enzyme
MRVGLYDDPVFREHDAGPGHPERSARLDALVAGLRSHGLLDRLISRAPRDATRDELLRVHTAPHVDRMADTTGRTQRFDADTQASPASFAAARRAAGAVTQAVEQVLAGGLDRAWCLVRPPGHHAEADRAMGFCLFNNVAVAAAAAIAQGLQRVLVIDFDVHHGNGTQHMFEEDPRVLYISSHAFPFYPGTGALREVGRGAGTGFTVNLPLPQGAGDAEYVRIYREIVEPIGRAYDPELVLVSAGFDAYVHDPLAGMRVTELGYGALMDVCLATAQGAARGRTVVAFEGGYDLDGLARCGAVVAERLLGEKGLADAVEPGPSARWLPDLLRAYRTALAPYWPALQTSS